MNVLMRLPSFLQGLHPLRVLVVTASVQAAMPAWAVEPFEIRDIRVEGMQRSDPGTVFGALPFRIGDTYNDVARLVGQL